MFEVQRSLDAAGYGIEILDRDHASRIPLFYSLPVGGWSGLEVLDLNQGRIRAAGGLTFPFPTPLSARYVHRNPFSRRPSVSSCFTNGEPPKTNNSRISSKRP